MAQMSPYSLPYNRAEPEPVELPGMPEFRKTIVNIYWGFNTLM